MKSFKMHPSNETYFAILYKSISFLGEQVNVAHACQRNTRILSSHFIFLDIFST